MTLPLATYRTAIETWIAAQSGITVQARDNKGGWQSKPRIRYHLQDSDDLGVDWLSWAQDEDLDAGADYVPTVHGNRSLLLSIQCETRDQSGNTTAMYYLEKLRSSLKKPSTRATLYAAGLVVSSAERVMDLSSWVDDRIESKAHLDLHLSAVVNDRDEAEGESFVEKTTVTGTFTTPAGEDIGGDAEELP